MTYLFDFQVIVREGEIAKGSMQGCPTAKSVFKLRAGYEKEITVTITQSSKQQMIIQSAVGLLIGDGTSVNIDDSSTSFFVNSRTLMGCTDPLKRGVGAPHQCPLESVASYLQLIHADVRSILTVLWQFKGG